MKTSNPKKPKKSSLGRTLFAGILGIFGICLLLSSFGRTPDHASLAISSAADAGQKYVTKQIQGIQEGDVVLARDELGDEIGQQRVVEVYRNTSDHLRILEFESNDGVRQTLKTTNEHPFWDEQKADYIAAKDLTVGDEVVGPTGEPSRLVSSIYEPHPEGLPVFNFQVEDAHTYYVKANGINAPPVLVHNACEIIGKPHGIPEHKSRILQIVERMKASGKYAKVYINKSLKTITGGKVNDLRRPDVAGVLKDGGKIDVIEVPHPGQRMVDMQNKINSMKQSLGSNAGPDSIPEPL